MIAPTTGILLIAEPFLRDPSFKRSVVLLCSHNEEEGTFGFALNKKMGTTFEKIIPEMAGWPADIYEGGPVHKDTLHYLHQYPEYFPAAVKIIDNVYWGGDFEQLKDGIRTGALDIKKIKFFLVYSGWSAGQLKNELAEKSWLTVAATKKILFEESSANVWNASLTQLGGKFKLMIHYPTDPQLN